MTWANDNLANATAVSGSSGSITPLAYDSTVDPATSETLESVYGAGETLWWKWTAPSSGDFEFATVGSPSADANPNGLDTKMQVFSGPSSSPTYAALTFVDSNDDNDAGDTYAWNSRVIFTAVSGTTYYVQTDMYSSGQAGTLHLAWAPHVTPPPAPTAGSWSSSGTYDPHTLFPGDDATVAGTDLDTVTTVTVGGVGQPFTATSSTSLVVHVNSSAVSGPIVVSNSSGSATATGDATVLYPGPWTYPADQTATDVPGATGQASSYGTPAGSEIPSTTQPDPAGSGFLYGGAGFGTTAQGGGPSSPSTTPKWTFTGAVVVLDERAWNTPNTMPDYLPTAEVAADPHAVDYEIATGDTPAPTSDLTITFDVRTGGTSGQADGTFDEDSDGRSLTDDLWQARMEYRRLPDTDWTFDGFLPKFTSAVWPAASYLAALPLDFDRSALNPGASLSLSSASVWTDNRSGLVDGAALGPQGATDVTWADFGTSRAWAVALSPYIDDSPLIAPRIDPDTSLQTGSTKALGLAASVRATWLYQPRRYRLLYDTPPVAAAVSTLRRRQQAAPVGSAPRRRQVANRAGSLRRGPGAAP